MLWVKSYVWAGKDWKWKVGIARSWTWNGAPWCPWKRLARIIKVRSKNQGRILEKRAVICQGKWRKRGIIGECSCINRLAKRQRIQKYWRNREDKPEDCWIRGSGSGERLSFSEDKRIRRTTSGQEGFRGSRKWGTRPDWQLDKESQWPQIVARREAWRCRQSSTGICCHKVRLGSQAAVIGGRFVRKRCKYKQINWHAWVTTITENQRDRTGIDCLRRRHR